MSCPVHPQWYHDREDCPFCAEVRVSQLERNKMEDDVRDQIEAARKALRKTRADLHSQMLRHAHEYSVAIEEITKIHDNLMQRKLPLDT